MVSQVIIHVNTAGNIIAYSGIARDIFHIKRNWKAKNKLDSKKIEDYNEVIKRISSTNYSDYKILMLVWCKF
jgi:hypothetical protein